MVLAKRMILTLTLLLLAYPALAAVERFTDAKGTIHITNNVPQTQEYLRKEASPREAEELADAQEHPDDNLSKFTDAKGTIHLTNLPVRNLEPQQTAEAGPKQPSVPLSPASKIPMESQNPWSDRQAMVLARVLRAGLPPFPEKPANFPVRKFRDRQGIIHITNAARKPEQVIMAGWSSQDPAAKAPEPTLKPAKGMPKKKLARPVHMVTLSPALLPADELNPPAGPPPASGGARVHRFRDGKGVLHLVSETRTESETFPLWPGGIVPRENVPRLYAATMELYRMAGSYAGGTLLVRKDKQGKVHISNYQPIKNGQQTRTKESLKPILVEAALTCGLPIPLIEAVIKAESNFNITAVSPKGAMGLMQLMPDTAEFLGVKDVFCPRENVLGGCRYLRMLLDSFNQSLPLALAAYNAGHQRVIGAGFKVPDIKETKAFVTQVLGTFYVKEKSQYGTRLNL